MLNAIRNFFDKHIAAQQEETEAITQHRVQIAAAVLLVEVARSDHTYGDAERQTVLASIQRKFGLSPAEAQEVIALAEAESREAHDIFQFTSQIEASFTVEQKVKLLEELWRAAYADSVVHEYEEHLIRRVADMLHLSHSQFIGAKLRVSEPPTS